MRIDLAAAESIVIDPVAFSVDEDRKLCFVEDTGYPDPTEGGLPTKLVRVVF